MPLSLPQSINNAPSAGDLEAMWLYLFNTTVSAEELAQFSEEELKLLQHDYMMVSSNASCCYHHHVDDPEYDFLRRPAWRGLILTLYVTVIVIGLVGNAVVVFIVAKSKHMQNVTNIFIANLALSDIGLSVFSLPIQLHYQITDNWIFGTVMCKIIFAAFAVPMYVSTITIFLIACDRYWLIVYPLKERMQLKTAIILIISAITLSIVLAIPVICFAKVVHIHHPDLRINRKYCTEEWSSPMLRIIYSFSTFLFQFCLPLIITALLYYKIYCRLQSRPLQSRATNAERNGKTNKILFAIVVLFVTCWLPWNLFSLITEVDKSIVIGAHFKLVDLLLKMFAMSSACINPFLYCWLNDNFRKELDLMAIKLHLLRPGTRNGPQIRYQVTPTQGENGNTVTYGDNNIMGATTTCITADRISNYSNCNSNLNLCNNNSTNNNTPTCTTNFLTVA